MCRMLSWLLEGNVTVDTHQAPATWLLMPAVATPTRLPKREQSLFYSISAMQSLCLHTSKTGVLTTSPGHDSKLDPTAPKSDREVFKEPAGSKIMAKGDKNNLSFHLLWAHALRLYHHSPVEEALWGALIS